MKLELRNVATKGLVPAGISIEDHVTQDFKFKAHMIP